MSGRSCWRPARRRGIGRSLANRLEQTASNDGRSLLLAEATLPFADHEGHAYRRFAESCGYELSNCEIVRHLAFPVPEEQIQVWIDEAAPRHPGYTIETFVGAVPDDLVESLCGLLGRLAVDAPTGTVDFEEETMSPQRYAELVATTASMGRVRYETVALTPGRRVVAQSNLVMALEQNTRVYQWGTFVHREHRGHRLGLATKAVNLRAVQAARGDLTFVINQNAETNDPWFRLMSGWGSGRSKSWPSSSSTSSCGPKPLDVGPSIADARARTPGQRMPPHAAK